MSEGLPACLDKQLFEKRAVAPSDLWLFISYQILGMYIDLVLTSSSRSVL